MNCLHCEEEIHPLERGLVPVNEGSGWMHAECMFRKIVGSADHIRRGAHPVGTCLPDDPSLSKREAARAAASSWFEKEGCL